MIIDLRNRPPTPEFEAVFDPDALAFVSSRLQNPYPAHFERHSLEGWHQELVDAGVDRAVVVGRSTRAAAVPNDHVAALQRRYPDRVVGAAGIDVAGDLHDPVDELRRCVGELGLRVAAIDPGCAFGRRPHLGGMYADDARIFRFYEAASELGVPVVLMTGPFAGADISYSRPEPIDVVATEFPTLPIIAGHGCYPYVTEAICVAYKHPNVYLAPDAYLFCPGGEQYVQAASTLLRDQVCFATAYPFSADVTSVLARTRALGLDEGVLDAYLGGNAARALAAALKEA